MEKITVVTRELPVGRPSAETNNKANRLAFANKKLLALRDEKRDTLNAMNREIKRLEGVVDELSTDVVNATEVAMVRCTQRVVEADWELEVVRDDTGDVVETREMTDAEIKSYQQQSLPLEGGPSAGYRFGRARADDDEDPEAADATPADGEEEVDEDELDDDEGSVADLAGLPGDDDEDPDYGEDWGDAAEASPQQSA